MTRLAHIVMFWLLCGLSVLPIWLAESLNDWAEWHRRRVEDE